MMFSLVFLCGSIVWFYALEVYHNKVLLKDKISKEVMYDSL